MGNVEELLCTRFSICSYNVNKRPEINKLTKHLSIKYSTHECLNVQILQDKLPEKSEHQQHLGTSRLQTWQPTGHNIEVRSFVEEICKLFIKTLNTQSYILRK